MLLENKLLEQEIRSVKEQNVSVAQWLVRGSAAEVRPVCRQQNPDGGVGSYCKAVSVHITRP